MRRRSTRSDLFWERFTGAKATLVVAVSVVCSSFVAGCGREAANSHTLNSLSYDTAEGAEKRSSAPPTAEQQFVTATERLRSLVEKQARRDLTSREQRVFEREQRGVLRTSAAVQRQFAAEHVKLTQLGADDAVKRLEAIQRATAAKRAEWIEAAQALPSGKHDPHGARRAQDALAALAPEPQPQPTSSGGAFGANEPVPAQPVLSAGITPAYGSPLPNASGSSLPNSPEVADLEESPETKITPAIAALADDLDQDPVKIYRFVRNNIRYEPYFGIRKGASVTLSEKSGSDADQAALTISLLRASDVPARFVRGTVELPAATAANWLGVNTAAGERADAAPDILTNGGIPTTAVNVDGELTKVRFDHIWLEAHVDSDAYRGVAEQQGRKRWLPLDPSIKPNVLRAPEVDLLEVLEPAALGWLEDVGTKVSDVGNSSAVFPTASEAGIAARELTAAGQRAIAAAGSPDSLEDLTHTAEIRQVKTPYLPTSLPFATRTVAAEWRSIPTALDAEVTISVVGAAPLSIPAASADSEGALHFAASTHDLAEKRVTLAYVPASLTDAEVIDAYHGVLNTPAYAAQLTPVLWVDGRVVARGTTPVPVGYQQRFTIKYRSPGFASDTVENPVVVGSLSALTLAVGDTSPASFRARTERQIQNRASTTEDNVLTDQRVGEFLAELGGYYFVRNNSFNSFLAQAAKVSAVRAVSGAIAATNFGVTYVAGFPVRAKLTGLTMDVDYDVQAVVAKSAANPLAKQYLRTSAAYASSSESQIFNNVFEDSTAVSTLAIQRAAADQEIPIVEITPRNVAQLDSLLDVAGPVKADIRRAVEDEGAASVLVPKRTVQIGNWRGSGYVAQFDGAFDYRISGGQSGGSFGEAWNEFINTLVFTLKAPPVPPPHAGYNSIFDLFDAYEAAIVPWAKDAGQCYKDWRNFGEGYQFTEQVAATMIGLWAASSFVDSPKGVNIPQPWKGQLMLGFELGSIGVLLSSSAIHGTQAALIALECGA